MTDSVNYTGQKKQGMAIACLILGILSIVASILVIGLLFGFVGIILGIVRFTQKPEKKGMLWTGIVLCIFGIIFSCTLGYMYYIAIQKFVEIAKQGNMAPGPFPNPQALRNLPGPPLMDISTCAYTYTLQPVWQLPVNGGETLALGDWDLDGKPDIEIGLTGSALQVYSIDSKDLGSMLLPGGYSAIEYGHLAPGQPALLGYSNWGGKIDVLNTQGKIIWSYNTRMGTDGAHWGDLNGDGNDEMIVGFNGGGGLHAVNGSGQQIWKTYLGNVWCQAVIPETANHPALVVATEAGGSVRMFSGQGQPMGTIRPLGQYASPMNAANMDGKQNIQIAVQVSANNQFLNAALDTSGNALWKCEVQSSHGSWRKMVFAHGDLDGDGIEDWAFLRKSNELVVISGNSNLIADIPVSSSTKSFAILTRAGQPGLLIVLNSSELSVFEPKPVTSNP